MKENEITFHSDSDLSNWIMKLSKNHGIIFNRSRFPDWNPDDFAQAVIEIIERAYFIKFEKKSPPYDREKNE